MRILIVDDEADVHDAYRLCFRAGWPAGIDAPPFQLLHAGHGEDAVDLVSAAGDDPFAVAFVDVRMAPGIDGCETARRLRAIDPEIQIVLVEDAADRIACGPGPIDKLFHLTKPLVAEEVVRAAETLVRRWRDTRELAELRTALAEKITALEAQQVDVAANEMRAIHLANHDPLTDAPNRLSFMRSLSGWAGGDARFAMAVLDLDRFKLVNDTFGHLVGDELLRIVYARLREALPAGGTMARLGGDEFALLFPTAGQEAAIMDAERMLLACSGSVTVLDHPIKAAASMGLVVVDPADRECPIDVMRRADLALNEVKRSGRGAVRLFDMAMDQAIRFRSRIENGLGRAIANGKLRLVYQPIVVHDSLEVVGFEALMRWQSEEYGTIGPAMFIPIAEETNLIHELGDWALDEALAMLEAWPGQYVSVNFSPRQFRRHNFVGEIVARVEQAGISPSRLQIEITETAIFDDAERAAETLYRLRQMGFRIALDDFGTGYSSLCNIRKFALDCLKIDRSFIECMGREREAGAIVQSIIQLGQALGLEVVAEGVETEAHLQALRIAGCSHMQGYYLSHPLEAEDAIELVSRVALEAPMPVSG